MKMTVEKAEHRIAVLEEAVLQLQRALGAKTVFPGALRLSRHEGIILGILLKRRLASRETLLQAMYDGDGPEFADRILSMAIHTLRKKATPLGAKIRTVYGFGYDISEESQEKLRAALEKMAKKDA